MASQLPSPISAGPAGGSAANPRSRGMASSSSSSSTPPPPSRHHVTPQVLTLGRDYDDDDAENHQHDDYYRREEEGDERGPQPPPNQGASPSSPSWYMRILPKNPFASVSASAVGDEASRGGAARRDGSSSPTSEAATDTSSYRSLGGGGDGGEGNHGQGVRERLSSSLSRRDDMGPARQQRYIPTSDRHPQGATVSAGGGLTQPILRDSASSNMGVAPDLSLRGHSERAASVEEEIMAQQSFFYREESSQGESLGRWHRQSHRNGGRRPRRGDGLELSSAAALSSSSNATPFRTLRYDPARTTELGYRDLASLHVSLAPPVLGRYRAKYELLNQPMARSSRRGRGQRQLPAAGTRLYHFYNADPGEDGYDYDDDDLSEGGDDYYVSADDAAVAGGYDLELCEQSGPLSKVRRTDSATLSSLLYRSDRGRVLLRLPSDQVRLVMDPDLQPGILSVEQWRKCEQEYSDESSRPSLHYVLTVQEDLYRKIVGELSDGVTNPYCGMSKCCSEKEFVDIRVAVAIIGFTLSVLLLLTFVWPVT